MKNLKVKMGAVALGAIGLLVSGCSSETDLTTSGATGHISPEVLVDNNVVTARSSRGVELTSLTPADLSLRMTGPSATRTWQSVSEFDASEAFTIGAYTMEAWHGALEDEGFEKPYVYGSADFTIKADETTPVSITARLGNAMVKIAYTEAFTSYFADYSGRIHSAGGAYIDFASDETRAAYVRPGDVDLFVTVKRPSGVEATLQPTSFTAEAGHLYNVTVDLNGGQGSNKAELVVSIDESLTQEDVTLDISDDVLSAPAPAATPGGFTNGETISVLPGTTYNGDLAVNIIAMGGLKSVTLTTQSTSLLSQGWPAEIDLIAATPAQKADLTAMGLTQRGLWSNPDKVAIVNLAGVTESLGFEASDPLGNVTTFTIVVKDNVTKVSDIVTLKLQAQEVNLTLSAEQLPTLYDATQTYTLSTNLVDLSQLKIQKKVNSSWQDVSFTPQTRVGDTMPIIVNEPVVESEFDIRAVCGKIAGPTLHVTAKPSPYSLSVASTDVWATKAYVGFTTASSATHALRASRSGNPELYISTDGKTFTAATIEAVAGEPSKVIVKGLTPSTTYTIKYSVIGGADGVGPVSSFTTESAAAVPNGDFEELTQEFSVTDQAQGGRYRRTAIGTTYGTNHQDITVSRPTGWATTNAKTYNQSASNQNSWFVVASVLNSNLSFTTKEAKISGMGGTTFNKDNSKVSGYNFSAQNGNVAMRVRNVAYDAAGTNPADHTNIAATPGNNYYSDKTPSIANKAVGKLFLGSYSFSGGNETYNEGVSFTSRPTALKGYYTYTNDSQDTSEKGQVSVKILSGDTVIGEGTASLGAANDFTQFTVNISYSRTDLKATSLRIMIASSNHAGTIAQETAAVKTTAVTGYTQVSYGAALTVDNLTFAY